MKYIAQEDSDGCGVAVLAMLTGQTFAEVDATVGRDATDHTVKPHEMQHYLCARGFFLRVVRLRSEAPGEEWPPRAFAPMHYLMVDSPAQPTGHWVVMDNEGFVLDASRNGNLSSFYKVCQEAVGVLTYE